MEAIDPYILQLMEFDGFCKQFYLYCGDYQNQEQAYEATERLYSGYFGKRKYASWECFKELKNRKLRK
jgi:hypothetical protein